MTKYKDCLKAEDLDIIIDAMEQATRELEQVREQIEQPMRPFDRFGVTRKIESAVSDQMIKIFHAIGGVVNVRYQLVSYLVDTICVKRTKRKFVDCKARSYGWSSTVGFNISISILPEDQDEN